MRILKPMAMAALAIPVLLGFSPAIGGAMAQEATATATPKPPSAKRLYLRRTCMACHGKDGARAIQAYPDIAGLDAAYIRTQIKDILSKKRQGSNDPVTGHPRAESMRGSLVTADGEMRISDDEIKILADWLSKLDPAGPQVHDPALSADRIAAGEAAYKKGRCRTCHGVGGNKPLKGYPRLAGQKSAYLVAQMIDIRDGARTNGRSRMMLPFVKRLSDEEIGALADYLSQIDPNQ
ncbi:MAG: c-type cytochrome [Robiginitomaculum sp.]|nr:c-type cytochrome [Robiginitomaculum sp.]MDQ7076743.1 c-type cytochrome [Robiginitomaculum sp.]